MAEFSRKEITKGDIKQFSSQLSRYDDSQLVMFCHYFWEDLMHIIEIIDTQSLLREQSSLLSLEKYLCLKKQCGNTVFRDILLQDILDIGRDAIQEFWKRLYTLQNDYPHPNLLAVLGELIQPGKDIQDLERQINWDTSGRDLPEDLKGCQLKYKQYLRERTGNLVENQAPGLKEEPLQFPISERYLDLVMVSSHQFRKRSQHEVIATGGIHEHYLQKEENNMERSAPKRLFRWCHRLGRVPHKVLVSGVPGIGKTTLLQKFVYDWASGNIYQRFDFVFFFKFRELKSSDVSLVQIILDEHPDLHSQLSNIFQYPENLLFIFDGLDESKTEVNFKPSQAKCTNPQSIESLNCILSSLVGDSLLKGCSVLITSRPVRLALTETSVFHRISEIMGFFPEQRKMYFQNFFKDDKMATKAFQYVKENGSLYTFCYIPSYCWIVCTVLSKCFRKEEFLPKTVTQLLVVYISNILANHSHGGPVKETLTSIGLLAEYGVLNHILLFESESLESFKINTSLHLVSSLLMESSHCSRVSYSFLHLIIQEFFAALVHCLDYSPENLGKTLKEARRFKDGRGEMLLLFMSGLSDPTTVSLLSTYFGDLLTRHQKHVIKFLQESFDQDVHLESRDVDYRKVLSVFACLAETRNKALIASCLKGGVKYLNFSEFYLTPLDCTVLAFIIESLDDCHILDLSSCFIQSEGLERFAPVLHNVTELRLSNNNLVDEDMRLIHSVLTRPDCRIQTLSLQENGLTDSCCAQLALAINENNLLKHLNLSKNKLAGEELCYLLEVLANPHCRIEKLGLQDTKLSDTYAKPLVRLTNNRNLTHLNIRDNFLSDNSYTDIKNLILQHPSLKEIKLEMNEFSDKTKLNLRQLQEERPDMTIGLQ
ncbi:hypothetical protein GDO86_016625 [Hymenochirus boettgeri]|uniref:NACHT domain-containing protein n=1 Tax=Hymenochirus boettgeri TaxID=247094 RepID=A0A8T2K3P8_9PIPI|nr:hypothetical protein GDO86_016625 [Hymenochirus boettgeri]